MQAAIHANTSHLPYPWDECSNIVNYSRDDLLSSMLPVYRDLIAAGVKMLVFSGDVDAIVPVRARRARATVSGVSECLCDFACVECECGRPQPRPSRPRVFRGS